jgi:hypothetical protein
VYVGTLQIVVAGGFGYLFALSNIAVVSGRPVASTSTNWQMRPLSVLLQQVQSLNTRTGVLEAHGAEVDGQIVALQQDATAQGAAVVALSGAVDAADAMLGQLSSRSAWAPWVFAGRAVSTSLPVETPDWGSTFVGYHSGSTAPWQAGQYVEFADQTAGSTLAYRGPLALITAGGFGYAVALARITERVGAPAAGQATSSQWRVRYLGSIEPRLVALERAAKNIDGGNADSVPADYAGGLVIDGGALI